MSDNTSSQSPHDGFLQSLSEMCGDLIPKDFVRLIQDYPPALQHAVRAEDGTLAEGYVSNVELLSDPRDILSINQEARLSSILAPDGEEFFWPEQLLIIGETGAGDYFCLDTSGEHEGVLQFLHHSVEFEQIAESLAEYVDMLIETFQTVTTD